MLANYTSLQKKFDEMCLQENLCFPVMYISLIKKRAHFSTNRADLDSPQRSW